MLKTVLSLVAFGAIALTAAPGTSEAAYDGFTTSDKTPFTISKRSKPRIPGGSGCDDPRDLIEHPECGGLKAGEPTTLSKRSKPRIPGGSGCDDPRDLIEHPECAG